MAITAAEVVTAFGAYYMKGSQNVQSLIKPLFAQSETEQLFYDKRITEDTKLQGSPVEISDVLQGYQNTYTPMGDTTFHAAEIPLYEIKVDLMENPSSLEQSWLGFLTGTDIDRKQWPFIRWWLEQLVLPKMQDNWEKKGIFWGVKGATTSGTANPINTAINGIRQQINAAVTAGKCVPLAMGAVPSDPVAFVDYIEGMAESIDPVLRAELDVFVMSRTLEARFKKGMGLKYNMYYNQTDNTTEKNFGIGIKGVLSHEGSTKIWNTLKMNRTIGIKKPGNDQVFALENIDRTVKAYTDYWRGIGFWRWDWFVTNDQDLV